MKYPRPKRRNNMPWLTDLQIETVVKYLNENDIMLEYGAGGSTMYFPKYVKDYYSIEHEEKWCHQNFPDNSARVADRLMSAAFEDSRHREMKIHGYRWRYNHRVFR